MRILGFSLGAVVWFLLLFFSVPLWLKIGGLVILLIGVIYGFWCQEYINQRYIQLIADDPEDKEKWFREYRWNHPISTFFFELGGND
jgi:hypothetical protein